MLNYNICFMKQGNAILLLNREYAPWRGCWNGIGGKMENDELPRTSMIREIYEETGMSEADYHLHFRGFVTWSSEGANYGGMYLYYAEVEESLQYAAPRKTEEGILDWKEITWIMLGDNKGVVSNIVIVLETLMKDGTCYDHHCEYAAEKLVRYHSKAIDAAMETNKRMREAYLSDASRVDEQFLRGEISHV